MILSVSPMAKQASNRANWTGSFHDFFISKHIVNVQPIMPNKPQQTNMLKISLWKCFGKNVLTGKEKPAAIISPKGCCPHPKSGLDKNALKESFHSSKRIPHEVLELPV